MAKLDVESTNITIEKEQIESWYIMFAIPCYDQQISEATFMSIIKMTMYCRDRGIKFAISTITDSLISRARNNIAAKFLANSEFTHMMFIDADIGFQASDIIGLLNADKDVIAGIYPKKVINWNRIESAVKAGVATEELQFHTGDLVVSLVDHERERVVKLIEPVEVYGAGTGFMLIKRTVLETLKDKVDTYLDNDGKSLYEYFFLVKDPVLKQQLTEDYAFCRLCRMNGFKIYVAPWIKLSHTGSYIFTGQPIPVRA